MFSFYSPTIHTALAFEGLLPFQVPLPWKELFIAFTFQGLFPSPSKGLFAFAFEVPLHLP
jgi:hypothetical protein